MPWSNNSGGPCGGGRGPGGGGGGGGPQPPDLDELFRKSQERLKQTFGGGGGGMGGGISKPGMLLAGVLALLLYAYLCFYQVGAGRRSALWRIFQHPRLGRTFSHLAD